MAITDQDWRSRVARICVFGSRAFAEGENRAARGANEALVNAAVAEAGMGSRADRHHLTLARCGDNGGQEILRLCWLG